MDSGAYQAIPVNINEYFSGIPTLSGGGGGSGSSRDQDDRKKLYLLGGLVGVFVLLLVIVLPIVHRGHHRRHGNHHAMFSVEEIDLVLQEEEDYPLSWNLPKGMIKNEFAGKTFEKLGHQLDDDDYVEGEDSELDEEEEFMDGGFSEDEEHMEGVERSFHIDEDNLQSEEFYDDDDADEEINDEQVLKGKKAVDDKSI